MIGGILTFMRTLQFSSEDLRSFFFDHTIGTMEHLKMSLALREDAPVNVECRSEPPNRSGYRCKNQKEVVFYEEKISANMQKKANGKVGRLADCASGYYLGTSLISGLEFIASLAWGN